MEHTADIHKAGGVLIQDKKFLVTRASGKEFFVAPGGKLEAGESAKEALVRELREELSIEVGEQDLEPLGSFFAPAAGNESKHLRMDVFFVRSWRGGIVPANEVEEIRWIGSTVPQGMKLGSIFQHDVLPLLKEKQLID